MKIAIVEDALKDSELLSKHLKQYFFHENIKLDISHYNSGEDFLVDGLDELDMVFLDIQMDGINGMEVAARIRESNQQAVIIFVTNNPQYSLAGYSVDALDYLIKPVSSELLQRVLSRAVRRLGKPVQNRFTIHNSEGIFVVNLEEIHYIEILNRKLKVYTTNGAISCTKTMQAMEKQLPTSFFRCHSAFVINLLAVECLKGPDVVVAGKLIPVSKHRRSELVRALTDIIGDKL